MIFTEVSALMLRGSYPVIKILVRSLSARSKYEHNVHMPYAFYSLLSAWKANKAMCRNDEWCVAYDRTATTLPPPSLPLHFQSCGLKHLATSQGMLSLRSVLAVGGS